jgi:hypothetical protein
MFGHFIQFYNGFIINTSLLEQLFSLSGGDKSIRVFVTNFDNITSGIHFSTVIY